MTGDGATEAMAEVEVVGDSWPPLGETMLYRIECSADSALMECDSRGCLLKLPLMDWEWRAKADD